MYIIRAHTLVTLTIATQDSKSHNLNFYINRVPFTALKATFQAYKCLLCCIVFPSKNRRSDINHDLKLKWCKLSCTACYFNLFPIFPFQTYFQYLVETVIVLHQTHQSVHCKDLFASALGGVFPTLFNTLLPIFKQAKSH